MKTNANAMIQTYPRINRENRRRNTKTRRQCEAQQRLAVIGFAVFAAILFLAILAQSYRH